MKEGLISGWIPEPGPWRDSAGAWLSHASGVGFVWVCGGCIQRESALHRSVFCSAEDWLASWQHRADSVPVKGTWGQQAGGGFLYEGACVGTQEMAPASSPWPVLLVLLVFFIFYFISFDSTLAFILLRLNLSCHLEAQFCLQLCPEHLSKW